MHLLFLYVLHTLGSAVLSSANVQITGTPAKPQLCSSSPGSEFTVTFLTEHGKIPLLRPSASAGTISVVETTAGTKESALW